tara:strand:- start:19 stop:201 length:183 start_codon:yes stop_codon:yes gene_type:complete
MSEYNITSARYMKGLITNSNVAVKATIDGVTMSVPMDPANRHYAAILEWVAEGNTIQEAD